MTFHLYQHGHQLQRWRSKLFSTTLTSSAPAPQQACPGFPCKFFNHLQCQFSTSSIFPSTDTTTSIFKAKRFAYRGSEDSAIPTSGSAPLIHTVDTGMKPTWSGTPAKPVIMTTAQTEPTNPTWARVAQVIMEVSVGNLDADSPFDLSYITWRCELPTDPELDGQCQPSPTSCT